jgi:glycine hydroxymethyltransferase
MLIDLTERGITGLEAEKALSRAGIMTNKNAVPFDKRGPRVTSGLRIGTPALTTRGMKEPEMKTIAGLIKTVLENPNSDKILEETRGVVFDLCRGFPIYEYLDER